MTNQETDRLIEIGRMVALAERFASEGQMNLNKVLEAIAYAQIRRASPECKRREKTRFDLGKDC